jgi:D-glycero-alpha-D-manno-heptose-7-phosphate kinase
LAGGGTDVSPYCDEHTGFVLNATINLFAYCHIAPRHDGRIVFRAADHNVEISFRADEDIPLTGSLPLHRGAYNRIINEFRDGRRLSLTITTTADAPAGSGLGTSSTVMVSLVEAFKELLGLPLGEYDVARLAYDIERNDLKLSGGRQDQYAATFGGINFMEFGAEEQVVVNPLRVNRTILNEFEATLLLYFTGLSRDSRLIIDQQKANLVRSSARTLDAMHKLKADAVKMKQALLKGQIGLIARILADSWESKKQLTDAISNPIIDRAVTAGLEAGALAGKVSGAGGGGFVIFLVDPMRKPKVTRTLALLGGTVYPAVQIYPAGSEAWRTLPFEYPPER